MDTEEKLINLVHKHECLYDVNARKYSDRLSKTHAWENISKEMGMSVDNCIKKWKRLRDNYRKALKNRRQKSESGSTSKTRPIKYEKEFDFLKPYVLDREQVVDLSSALSNEDSSSSQYSDTGEPVVQDSPSDIPKEDNIVTQISHKTNEPHCLLTSLYPPSSSRDVTPTQIVSDVLQSYLQLKEEKHPVDTFFLAMAANVKKLPPKVQLAIKQKVFNVVYDAELKWLNEDPLQK